MYDPEANVTMRQGTERDHSMPTLFQAGSQHWFALDAIEAVEDWGWDIGVFLKSGKSYRINGSKRDEFLGIVEKLTGR